MPGPLTARPHRTKGSWIPRLTGVGIAVLVAAGILGFYLAKSSPPSPPASPRGHLSTGLSAKARSQPVGIIDFGPDNDRDAFVNDRDDHPLKLQSSGTAVDFVAIPPSEIASGTPQWTANQMSDGTYVFIYTPQELCLTAVGNGQPLRLAHCDLRSAQRWRPAPQQTALGQQYAAYASVSSGDCLTAPRSPGPAMLSPCGGSLAKSQEIAFWWNA
jgi:hypothetical protein